MRLCVINPSYERSSSEFRGLDPYCDPSRYMPEHQWECHLIEKATAVRQVRELSQRGFDVFVNLCDGAWDEDRAGIEVVQALERFELTFTGAASGFYEPTREAMKRVCSYAGIATPAFVFARDRVDVERAADTLRFPMIVKHPNSYGSVGMTRDSRVETAEALARRVEEVAAAYGGALVEEFIEGREFTVLVAEPEAGASSPRVFQPIEFRFPPGETFKHFDLKWIEYEGMTWAATSDTALSARLGEMSSALFTGLDGSGYGRCDLRMNADGELFVLEINPNCGIFYPPEAPGSADVILASDPAGHRGFLEHIIGSARRRRDRVRRRWEIRHDRARGYGTYALIDIAEGERVEVFEERAHHIVSRRHVERAWDEQRKRWFAQYAWPLTDEIFVMWSDRPEEWKPVNHACDPNAWLDGLDLVARRNISRDEAITVDYATFYGPAMEDFSCECGSALCRGVVRGTDHLAAFVGERYGDHVSDFVRRRRASAPTGA